MAFYSSSYDGSALGEYNYNSYALNYDSAQNSSFMSYDYQQFSQPYYGYDPNIYYDPAPTYPTISYSVSNFIEPKYVQYDPNNEKSHLVIYYSNNLEFNEPEFEEYDPTPYSGGYDIVQTYGKPLPFSDQTCYPPSGSSDSKALPSVPVIPLPYIEKGIVPQKESADQVNNEVPQPPQISHSDLPEKQEDKIHDTQDDLNSSDGEDSEEDESEEDGDDDDAEDDSRSGYGNGYNNGGQCEEYEKAVPAQYPYGYGLEALDICEGLFGYWPCLARMKRERGNCCEGVRHYVEGDCCYRENMWKGTADYLFGSPNPYGGGGEGGSSYGGEMVYAYQRHYPTQSQYRQVQNYGNSSWY